MKPRTGKTKSDQSNNYTAVLFEQMRDEIKGVAEGVTNLNEKMDRKFGEVDKNFSELKADMKSSFKSVMEYLSRIEDEIVDIKAQLKRIEENQVADRKEIDGLKARVDQIEEALKRHKISLGRTAHGNA